MEAGALGRRHSPQAHCALPAALTPRVKRRKLVPSGTIGVEREAGMKAARFRRLAVLGGALALAVPAVAQANEVTKWNEIAVNTVNAQPPLTSAPNAGSTSWGGRKAPCTAP